MAVQSSRVARQRKDFDHKLSTDLVKKHDLIAFEDLKIRNMVRNHALAKSIADAGWGQLRRFTEYKGRRMGKLVVNVLPAYSTQECYFCGALNQVPLSVRSFDCRGCSRMLDRDFNAAWIVLKRGLAPGRAGHVRAQACGDWASTHPDNGTCKPGRRSRNYTRRG